MVEKEKVERKKYTVFNCESKFLNLFGYRLIGPNLSNRYQILDKENQEVGYIQYKKLFSKDVKRGKPAIYGYIMEIDSKEIKCKGSRMEELCNDNFEYSFYLKKNGLEESARLYLGEIPNITIWSKEYGYIDFSIGTNKLFCDFRSKTKKHNFEDIISVECGENQKKYIYSLNFCNIDKDLEKDKETTTFDVSFEKGRYDRYMKAKEMNWKNGNIIFENEFRNESSVYTAINEFDIGLKSFRYFRYLMSEYLPFQKELVESFVEIVGSLNLEISSFVQDLKEIRHNRTFLDKCKEYLRVRRK